MSTLETILSKYDMDGLEVAEHIEIPNVGRDTLASWLRALDFKIGVEVGVQRGLYSEVLCRENPQMKVYGVDPWMSYLTCDSEEHRRKSQSHAPQPLCDQFYEETKKRMSAYPNYEIIKEYSVDAVKRFADNSIDFVYIDANHEYSFVMDDIVEWSKKIRNGGIISGHDYYKIKDPRSLMHVKLAVNDYVKANNIKPLVIWGINARTPGMIRDKWRSWSWVINK